VPESVPRSSATGEPATVTGSEFASGRLSGDNQTLTVYGRGPKVIDSTTPKRRQRQTNIRMSTVMGKRRLTAADPIALFNRELQAASRDNQRPATRPAHRETVVNHRFEVAWAMVNSNAGNTAAISCSF